MYITVSYCNGKYIVYNDITYNISTFCIICNIYNDSVECVLKPSQQQQYIYRIANGTLDNQQKMQNVDTFCKFVIQVEVSNHIKLTNYTQYFWN
jgi:hypothetical protein